MARHYTKCNNNTIYKSTDTERGRASLLTANKKYLDPHSLNQAKKTFHLKKANKRTINQLCAYAFFNSQQ